jgi:hypothetical protein
MDIELVLENIRINSIYLTKIHKKRYLSLKECLKFYRIPIIVFSSVNSIISVSQQFIPQKIITGINSGLALLCGIIGSIELYLGINSQMESELIASKEYYILATGIYKTLSLKEENRPQDMKIYLEECYNNYIKLLENSYIVNNKIDDCLTPIPKDLQKLQNSKSSSIKDSKETISDISNTI